MTKLGQLRADFAKLAREKKRTETRANRKGWGIRGNSGGNRKGKKGKPPGAPNSIAETGRIAGGGGEGGQASRNEEASGS